jgi:fructose 1,6-bisphosphatase
MKLTLTVIEADVGAIGGHARPSVRTLESVRTRLSDGRHVLHEDGDRAQTARA